VSGHYTGYSGFEDAVIQHQLTSGLRHSIDLRFRRLFDTAKVEWERRFAGPDPSDACVSVRVTVGEWESRGVASSGFLVRPAAHKFTGGFYRRFA
jgi:hypothetical protein